MPGRNYRDPTRGISCSRIQGGISSRAANGAFASTESQGNIGGMILEKFKIILDYKNNRVILEPNARFDDPIDYIRSGLDLESVGENYHSFKIKAVAEDSPASDAGLRVAIR